MLAAVTVLSACSVSSPRDGRVVSADGGSAGAVSGGGDSAVDGVVDGSSPEAGDAGTAIGSSGSGSGTGSDDGSTGGGATRSGATGSAGATGSSGGATSVTTAAPRLSTAPGVKSDSIAISVVAGFSGPLAPVVEKAFEGLATWQEDLNAAGGIHGRKIVLKRVDHKETADGGIAACKVAISNDTLFAAVLEGTEANVTAVSCLDAAGVPTLFYSGTIDPAWKIAFSDVVTSAQGGTILAGHVAEALGGVGKKVGVLYVNQVAYKAVSDTFVPRARKLGVQMGPVEAVEPNQASFTPQLLRMREAKVDILLVSATAEAIGILRDAKSIGFTPKITGWGFTFDFVTQAARDLFSGVTGLRPNATVDSPAYEKYAARMAARNRSRDRTSDVEAFLAYGHGLFITEMLKAAGPSPTRQSLVTGTETIRGYDNGILAPLNFGPGDHVGPDAAFPAVCCNADYTWKRFGAPRVG